MLNQLVDAWHGGVTEFAVFILRLLFVPLLIYNLTWSFRGCLNFLKSHMITISMYKSMIFFMSAGSLIRQYLFFTGYPNESVGPIALTSLCFLILASLLAALTHWYNLAVKLNTFYWLASDNNVDIAIRSAELAKHDREYMQGVLENAETTVVMNLARKTVVQK